VFSLPQGMAKLAHDNHWGWLATGARWGTDLTKVLPSFHTLWWCLIGGLAVFALALVVLSARHGRIDLALIGIPAAVLSIATVPGIAWLGVLAYQVQRFLRAVALAVHAFFGRVFSSLGHLFTGLWGWLVLAVVAVAVILLIVRAVRRADPGELWDDIKFFGPSCAGFVVLGLGFVALMDLVLVHVMGFLAIAETIFLTVVLCSVAGQLIIDQLRSSLLAGDDRLGVAMGAMGIGSALSLLLFASNSFGTYRFYPGPVAHWAEQYAYIPTGPQLDASITLIAVALSVFAVLRNLGDLREAPEWSEFHKSIVYQVLGLAMAAMLPALDDGLQHGNDRLGSSS
jgi:hypothetical protein